VGGIDTYPKVWEIGWEGGREKQSTEQTTCTTKAHGNAPADLPGTPN